MRYQTALFTDFVSNGIFIPLLEIVVGEEGFEPPTLWSQTRCATKLRYSPTKPTTLCAVEVAYNTPEIVFINPYTVFFFVTNSFAHQASKIAIFR